MIELNELHYGDCMNEKKGLPSLLTNYIDLIIIDPPYFFPTSHYQLRKNWQKRKGDIGILIGFFTSCFKEIIRILKKTGTLYIFCNHDSYPLFYDLLYNHCKQIRTLIWDKDFSLLGYTWRHQHEIILYATMLNTKPIPTGDGDVITMKCVGINERIHPVQKPEELIEKLILKSSKNGDIVLDCFAGSGTTLVVAKKLGRRYIGWELDPSYYKSAKNRLDSVIKRSSKMIRNDLMSFI